MQTPFLTWCFCCLPMPKAFRSQIASDHCRFYSSVSWQGTVFADGRDMRSAAEVFVIKRPMPLTKNWETNWPDVAPLSVSGSSSADVAKFATIFAGSFLFHFFNNLKEMLGEQWHQNKLLWSHKAQVLSDPDTKMVPTLSRHKKEHLPSCFHTWRERM